ncbi:MAG: hypothetical protein LBB47_00160 [Spirochaetaceae bacterium]|nr:hypothetical protein [Spirochaetaceae bacterium]
MTKLVAALVCLTPLLAPALGIRARNKGGHTIGSYITLVTDERVDGKLIAEKLGEAGIKDVLSESSQWVFLNDFSGLRRVPLDELSDVLLETDPRNDGYAGRLRSVFVRDGRRYFYIPASSFHSSNPAVIENRVSGALEATPYSLAMSNMYGGADANYALVFIAAALLSLVFSLFVSKLPSARSGGRRSIPEFTLMTAALLPACSLFMYQGPAGFALAAVALTFFTALHTQIKLLFIRLRHESGFPVSRIADFKQFLSKERKIFIFVFILFVAICMMGGVNIIYALTAVLFFCLSVAAYFYTETMPRGRGAHLRFVPVDIRPRRQTGRRVMLIALPFTFASVAVICVPFVTRTGRQTPLRLPQAVINKYIPAIGADDYERHVDFQKTFSFRKLGAATGSGNSAYVSFETGDDGLLYPAAGGPPAGAGVDGGVPPFPLEKLTGFLNGDGGEAVFTQGLDVKSFIAVLLALSIYIPNSGFALYGSGKKERGTLYISKSVTA